MKISNSKETIYSELAPVSQNNSREIFHHYYYRFLKYPSERLATKIAVMFGLEADWSDKDAGEPPANYETNE